MPTMGQALDLTFAEALGGKRRYGRVEVAGYLARSFGKDWSASVRFGAGSIKGRKGQGVSISDRSFPGGRGLRGFAAGGAGPRDYVAGSTDTPLGGQHYLLSSLELRRKLHERVSVGLFVDSGAAWGIDGAPVGAMGPIDVSRHLRSSAGLSVYWKTGVGVMNVSIAKPLSRRPYDQTNAISLGLVSAF